MNEYNESILKQAELLYQASPVQEITMGGTSNKIFEVAKEQTPYILRAAQYNPNREKHTAFELKWIDYLSNNMDGISRPIKSVNNNLYEVISAGGGQTLILSLFEKAAGKIVDIDNPQEFNPALFFNLGELMGNMHRLTINYEGNVRNPEFEWNGSANFWRANIVIKDEAVRLSEKRFLEKIHSLPIAKDNYGIIHYDIHTDNFFVENGKIKLFDFDACQFNWYAADMSSAVFFMVQKGAGPLKGLSEKERTDFAETYLISYLKGYMQTNTVSRFWIKKIDLLMKYQMIDEYICAQDYWPKELSDVRDWYLNWHGKRITEDQPYVFIDYEKVINSLPGAPSV